MQFRLLGTLEVLDDAGNVVAIAGRKPRALLTLLLLHANETLSISRLVDALWSADPPGNAPKAIHVYISRLRKGLEGSAGAAPESFIRTGARGYSIQIETDQLDLARFTALAEQGSRALSAGHADQASARLTEALALWRGPPLVEFADEPFAPEIARLEEIRLSTIEERVEADLALDRHAMVVAELGQLVHEHPFRERLRAQLMLAFARSGRQAEALAAYDEGRRRLVDDLGIEPGARLRELQTAILRQERSVASRAAPAAAAPAGRTQPDTADTEALGSAPQERSRRVRPAMIAAATVIMLVATVVAAVVARRDRDVSGPLGSHAVAILSDRDGTLVASVEIGARPTVVAVSETWVWVVSERSRTLSRIDPNTRRVDERFGLGFVPSGLAAGENAVWVSDAANGQLERFNAFTGARERVFDLGAGGTGPAPVAVGGGSVWAANSNAFVVVRIDPDTNRVVERIPVDAPRFIAAGPEGIWVVEAANAIREIDPQTNQLSTTIPTGFSAGGLALGADSAWLSDPDEDTVWRFDVRTRSLRRTVDVGRVPGALAFGSGSLWVANTLDGTVSRLDPESNEVVGSAHVGRRPRGLAVGAGRVWATIAPP